MRCGGGVADRAHCKAELVPERKTLGLASPWEQLSHSGHSRMPSAPCNTTSSRMGQHPWAENAKDTTSSVRVLTMTISSRRYHTCYSPTEHAHDGY